MIPKTTSKTVSAKSVLAVVCGLALGAAFSVGMYDLATRLSGAGHGFYSTDRIVGAPLDSFHYVWPFIFAVAFIRRHWSRWCVRVVSSLQIGAAVAASVVDGRLFNDFKRSASMGLEIWLAAHLGVYVCAHACLWMFTRKAAYEPDQEKRVSV